jgi:tetratricopeptide (TPR) repeat protein
MTLTRVYSECGDLARAIDVGEQTLSALPHGDSVHLGAEVELISTLAGCYLERGDLTRAQLLIRRALDRADRDGSPRARAAAAWNAAVIAESRHDMSAARVYADRALALYEEIDHALAVALMRVVSAGLMLRDDQPEPAEALALLERALDDLSEVGTPVDLGYAQTERARSQLLAGDPDRAQEAAHEALSCLAGGDRLQRGRVLLVLAQTMREQGDTPGALDQLRAAAEQLRASGATRQAAMSWRELGEAYVELGDPEAAVDCLRRAADLAGAPYHPVRPGLTTATGKPVGH